MDKVAALRGPKETRTPQSDDLNVSDHLLFEVCSEIGRQVGGVHTVLKTKAPIEAHEYGDRYTLVGRLECPSAAGEFDRLEPPTPELDGTMRALHSHGVKTIYGKWLVDGAPRVLLIDVKSARPFFDEWRSKFEHKTDVLLPPSDEMAKDALEFGYLTNWFFREFLNREKKRAVITQYHEWPSGLGCYLAADQQLPMATIFTAHATVLGRDLCDRNVDLHHVINTIDAQSEASKSPVSHRHAIERLAALSATTLTTVSDVTALECSRLLGRDPDVVLPNGMNTSSAASAGRSASVALRYNVKMKIRNFVHGHFYGQLDSFNAESALYFFLAGRYEYTNKGADMYIAALARLNERLKVEEAAKGSAGPSVVAFIIMPAEVESISTEALHRQATVKTIEDTVDELERKVRKKLQDRALVWKRGCKLPTETELVTEAENALLRRTLYGINMDNLPPLTTHDIANRRDDSIVKHLHRASLCNRVEDKVKVVFHPAFLSPSSSVFPIDYDSFVRGAHLGVFPSNYEPWGYTPAECLARGVPAMTSNVSGFGHYMQGLLRDVPAPEQGLYIIDRKGRDFEGAVEQTAAYMHGFCRTSQRERVAQRNRADRLSEFLDWGELHGMYRRVRGMALKRGYGREPAGGGEEAKRPRMPEIRQQSELSMSSYAPTPVAESAGFDL